MRGTLIRHPRPRLRRHDSRRSILRGRYGNCRCNRWRREIRRHWRGDGGGAVAGVFVVIVVARTGGTRKVGLDKAGGKWAEERPDRRNGHGDEDDPFFDFAPEEKGADSIWTVLVGVFQFPSAGWNAGDALTRRIFVKDELRCPRADNSGRAGENTTAHQETQTPFQLPVDFQWHEHLDGNDGEVEIRQSSNGTDKVGIVYAFFVVALILAKRIPERVDRCALEPDHEDLGDIEDDVQSGNGDETFADLGI